MTMAGMGLFAKTLEQIHIVLVASHTPATPFPVTGMLTGNSLSVEKPVQSWMEFPLARAVLMPLAMIQSGHSKNLQNGGTKYCWNSSASQSILKV